MVIVYIILGALCLFGLIWLIVFLWQAHEHKKHIIKNFERCNVVVDGKKGSGKDLIFQMVIHHRKDYYYSNIDYGYKLDKKITIKDISISPNTYNDFIENKVKKVKRIFRENEDIYISDGGVFLPSYMDATLYKKFPSFPLYYALSRHLYNSNVHVNVQNFTRLWKALREQADFFIHVKETRSIGPFLLTKCVTYDKYDSAIKYLAPIKSRLFNKYSKAEVDIYNAQNGDIRSGWVIQLKRSIKYNTRAFEKIILKGKRKVKRA